MFNQEDYIASGILELYAAGALSPEQQQEVEQIAAASPDVQEALNDALLAMEGYARAHAVAPRAALKDRIIQQIEDQQLEKEAMAAAPRPLYPEQENSPYKWMFAASITLFLISGILSFYFYQKWQTAENRLAIAEAQEQQLAQNFSTVSQQVTQQNQLLRLLRDENYKPVKLAGVEAHPDANAVVYWNASEQSVFIDPVQLPEPPAGSQYQLWALFNGKPIDAGLLQQDGQTVLQQMKQIGAAQAFAITLEPEGGSVNPTLEQLYVMGEVQS
ncbi:anti-sigma factor [Pontibacter rugosus]|uniref:Anti-sigma factor domain-containing protein n=1 Tax=Pontibacter rugosus TaxID=1745966 RepID=A0ABW3SQ03_9BACT